MRLIFQRVLKASVFSQEKELCHIDKGILVYLGLEKGDNHSTIKRFASKALKIRVWRGISKNGNKDSDPSKELEDNEEEKASPLIEGKKWETSVLDNDYEVLVVPMPELFYEIPDDQPQVVESLKQQEIEKLYLQFVEQLKKEHKSDKIKASGFGKDLQIKIIIDGPVTLLNEGF